MQIAALNPPYLNEASVPADVIEKEKEILIAQIANDEKLRTSPTRSSRRWSTAASASSIRRTA